ncbi:hypothetical protein [Phenylobacterium sp.]|uniref:hypothetical protein n=1 Tax=Phenylobacterium sp. TaxID=1871053 RepID=UPI0025FB3917|nr:hypothetical protein [Phenylobacterium sp.]
MGFAGAAAAIALPAAALAQPADLFFERTVMTAADSRCDLFTPAVSSALAAGAAQARGAALRAGADLKSLAAIEKNARGRAAQIDCASPLIASQAARIQAAYGSYARIQRMVYPGDLTEWRADRGVGRTARWRLSQSADFGSNRMIFGLAGRQDNQSALVAVGAFSDKAAPYSARLVMRDTGRTMGPYLLAGRQPLSKKLPPSSATRSYIAEARAGAETELLPKGYAGGWAFRFPTAAVQALSELDPREAVAVEFMLPGGRSRTAYVEVGDFAAGRAFLQIASR